jgi:hypothetical protein
LYIKAGGKRKYKDQPLSPTILHSPEKIGHRYIFLLLFSGLLPSQRCWGARKKEKSDTESRARYIKKESNPHTTKALAAGINDLLK